VLTLGSRDLSDLNKDGWLTKDGFAVAFHLIQSKLAGKPLPTTLPPSLVPPSLRGGVQPNPLSQQPAQEIQDLLWDDSPPPSAGATTQPTQPPLQPQRTGTLNTTPLQPRSTGSPQPPIQPQRTGPQLTQSTTVHPNGPAWTPFTPSAPAPDPFASSASRDFLSDDEPSAPAPPLEDKSAEIGNLHNQLSSTKRSLNTVTNERADIEQRLTEQATELSNLQTQLTAAKTAYETETKLLAALRERYANQNAGINKTRQELITAESDVSALRLEKNEIQNALLRDKEEVRELQKKMTAAGAGIETVKAEIEKIKKDAKQQKGLLAIAKKQLAAREAEKAKVESERDQAEGELVETTKEKDEAEAELAKESGTAIPNELSTIEHDVAKPSSPDILAAAIAQPLPDTPGESTIGSPSVRSPSVRSTNPFGRLTTASPPPSQSPFMSFSSPAEPLVPTQQNDDSNVEVDLDDPFGLGTSRFEEPEPISGGTGASIFKDRAVSPSSLAEAGDLFVTPPTSADDMHESLKGPEHTFTSLDTAASKFPAILGTFSEEPDSAVPTEEVAAHEDSSDEDEGPEEVTSPPKQPFGAPSPAPAEVSKKSSIGSSFDDVFGVSSETSASIISMPSTITPNRTGPDTSKSPFQSSFSTETNPLSAPASADKPENQPNGTIAGKNAFDEAMGVIPSSQTTENAAFSFDTSFDDDFDFVAAKADSKSPSFPTPFPAPASTQSPPANNGVFSPFPPAPTSTVTSPQMNLGFDNAFGVDNFSPAPAPGPPTIQVPGLDKEQAKPISFDTAFGTTTTTKPETTETETKGSTLRPHLESVPLFGGDRTSKTMALFNAFGSGSTGQTQSNPTSPVQPVQFPRPSTSPPPLKAPTPPPGSNGSVNSHREQSSSKFPPARPRPTTADRLKEKEQPTRTSRLSVSLKLLR
jgi:epidermal growth factor receptor substrate 15